MIKRGAGGLGKKHKRGGVVLIEGGGGKTENRLKFFIENCTLKPIISVNTKYIFESSKDISFISIFLQNNTIHTLNLANQVNLKFKNNFKPRIIK